MREYFPEDFKKSKPSNFDGEMKKLEDEKAWLFGMQKIFQLHDYSENMKSKISTLSLKGKVDMWWEYIKNVIGVIEEKLTCGEFKNIFRKKYLSKRNYDENAQDFYEIGMGSMTDEVKYT